MLYNIHHNDREGWDQTSSFVALVSLRFNQSSWVFTLVRVKGWFQYTAARRGECLFHFWAKDQASHHKPLKRHWGPDDIHQAKRYRLHTVTFWPLDTGVNQWHLMNCLDPCRVYLPVLLQAARVIPQRQSVKQHERTHERSRVLRLIMGMIKDPRRQRGFRSLGCKWCIASSRLNSKLS